MTLWDLAGAAVDSAWALAAWAAAALVALVSWAWPASAFDTKVGGAPLLARLHDAGWTMYDSSTCTACHDQLHVAGGAFDGRAAVDCGKTPAPDFVTVFPTWVRNGQILAGFQDVAELEAMLKKPKN